ncbi:hypothetical protein EDB81DRAFT_99380 [Dactylonectria macrodidyma]|uniref:Xylanolytic transcriptional activator regulatory domain-containing protein n=1 Tax=Dactylonectria macrodidyma TaxID=307937 RepID=A0A9P9EC52_9HYPO|nr:hypothetical protein EDB81DRAFT_99380 [Dactylonectria macrodidyma]
MRFAIPSRHTLSRFAKGYFRGFHEHLPFLHIPTLSLADLPADLVLGIIAMGALYRFEYGKTYELYFAAKELVASRLTEQTWAHSRLLVGMSPNYNGTSTGLQPIPSTSITAVTSTLDYSNESSELSEFLSPDKILRLTQALIILTLIGSWGEGALVTEGLELAGRLNALVRLSYYGNSDAMPDIIRWKDWIQREERRRTLLVAYTLLNTQSIAFNVPPAIVNRDIELYLPHPTKLWRAATAAKWVELKENSPHHERSFRDTLNCLGR